MKLKTILIAGFLLVAVLGSVIGFVANATFIKVETINSELQEIFIPNTLLMIEMQKKTYKIYSKGTEYIVIHRDYKEEAAKAKAEMKTAMAELKELGEKHFEYARYLDKEEKRNAQQILDKIVTFNYVMDGLIDFIENYAGDTEDIDERIAEIETNTVNSGYRILTDHLMEHRIKHEQELKDAEIEIKAAQISSRNIIIVTTIIIFILALIIGYTISLLITKPINILKENAEKLGKGNLDAKIEIISKNEIGELATSFNLMAEDLKLLSDADREKSEALEKLTNELEIKVEERTKELAEKVLKLDKSQKAMLFMVEDMNKTSKKLEMTNNELNDKAKKLETSQKSLSLLLEDVNESRAELDISNKNLNASNKELEAFSYSVSHDLRAPLRAIDGFTNILLEDYVANLDAEGKRIGSIIQYNARKMGQLIDDLLAFSRMGRADMHFSEIDMQNMANAIYHEATSAEERKRITFTIADLSRAKGDTNMMRQVLMNLISNAIKFSSHRKQSVISVTCREEENELSYCIKDNGAGFDMKYKDKLFGVFQRLHSEKEFEGTGVGLALVQRIIHRHGGNVWAEGEVDNGAAFYFSLPKT